MAETLTAQPAPLGFDPQELMVKYTQERAKRLRQDGMDQYQELKGAFNRLDQDTFASTSSRREPLNKDVTVLIIGGGYGGLLAAANLAKKGISDVMIVEKGAGFGGTWYWNQYPGARCDVESYVYLPLLEELGYTPKEKYVAGPDILQHVELIAKKYQLKGKALFQTIVRSTTWNDAENHWNIKTDHGDDLRARYVVAATGILHKPKLPGVPGIETFKGESFHTTHWNYDVTGRSLEKLANMRVANIGTGATSIQTIPILGEKAKQLYVFQRTPASVNVRNNRPTPPDFESSCTPGWQQDRMKNFNAIITGLPFEKDLVDDGWTDNKAMSFLSAEEKRDPATVGQVMMVSDMAKMERIRARVDELVEDKETAEKLKPWYSSMCKRPCFHDEYLQMFNRPNVTLVDTDGKGVERITENGIIANGVEYPVDLIVYASGFYISGGQISQTSGVEIVGRSGVPLAQQWDEVGAKTLFGVHIPDFPNFFTVNTTQAGVAANFMWTLATAGRQIGYVVSECEKRGIRVAEADEAAAARWTEAIVASSKPMFQFFTTCTPSYYNGEQKMTKHMEKLGTYGAGANAWGQLLEDWRAKDDLEGLKIIKKTDTETDAEA
ncbi:FAD/NAD(P)-binding domain-containing protein [Eremomyces bilateralis CBS 781.70]|uniref:FAD/NAD(P)-binding domain-containing protein n=1 Tax=Eremomyces bilateralis CBS 781.70 TaxID=1392243 RepID=A0A6G1FSE3_9PEZI|nr:FAD/NAD(P)-binding domain-containing protein [Eremomyces bilateralis CBS 781.70]KAF1808640.1 FAD/NAD(P)-binding domain-containing protein [Eremomyces bilateralis CBS 781.70]